VNCNFLTRIHCITAAAGKLGLDNEWTEPFDNKGPCNANKALHDYANNPPLPDSFQSRLIDYITFNMFQYAGRVPKRLSLRLGFLINIYGHDRHRRRHRDCRHGCCRRHCTHHGRHRRRHALAWRSLAWPG